MKNFSLGILIGLIVAMRFGAARDAYRGARLEVVGIEGKRVYFIDHKLEEIRVAEPGGAG
ncbi:hypothetical protein JD969_06470 [Planctomycetota bacterium]|nr:hypothetical protein JD969_06470 [Planctomycetota bacterium]